jgi:hypothetical protein
MQKRVFLILELILTFHNLKNSNGYKCFSYTRPLNFYRTSKSNEDLLILLHENNKSFIELIIKHSIKVLTN